MPPKGRPRRGTARKLIPVAETSQFQSDAVLEPSSQTLIPPDKATDDVNSSETLASAVETLATPGKQQSLVVAHGGEVPIIASCAIAEGKNNGGSRGGKPKKVVKKTIKVVKKVIKKVPKKGVKQGIDFEGFKVGKDFGNADLDSRGHSTLSAGINEEELKCGSSISGHLKEEIRDSDVLVNKVEVDEKNDTLEELEGERRVEYKGNEWMEVDDTRNNNGGDVERRGECGNEGEGLNEEERDRECGKEGEELGSGNSERQEERDRECGKKSEDLGSGEGGKKEERKRECVMEGEELAGDEGRKKEEVGKGKLFRGELEAMERKKRRKREIFIGRLDKDVKEKDVRSVFEEVGEIVDLRVLVNSKTGKKFAFVRYASAEDAQMALGKFANVEICGKEYGATPVEGNDTIFLGNIDKKWKDEDVVQLLRKIGIGKIDKVTVMADPNNTSCNRGFAFVEFETINDAQVAYTKLQDKNVFGKNQKLKVAWAEPLKELDEEEMLKVKTVYAEFIPSSWDEEKVKDIFMKFGEIDDIVLARNLRSSKRKDFAFISYKTRVAAVKCIDSFDLDLKDEDGNKVNVKVSLAKPKSKSKKLPAAKSFAPEIFKTRLKTSHSKVMPREHRNRAQPNVPHYGIQIPKTSSTNVELVQLLREQASWRPTHTSLSNSPTDIHYFNPLSGRKRQFSVLETDRMCEDVNIYPQSRLDASYSVANSSHSLVHPSGRTNPVAYHQQHSGYPSAGSVYGARNYASNVEIWDKASESSFLYRRY